MDICNSHMKILTDGTWIHNGRPIKRHNMVTLFASVLTQDDNGQYWLKTPVETALIEVEDVPFIITAVAFDGVGVDQTVQITMNTGDVYTIDADHPVVLRQYVTTGDILPYVKTKRGLLARPSRAVYYEMVAHSTQSTDSEKQGIWSSGIFYPLSP